MGNLASILLIFGLGSNELYSFLPLGLVVSVIAAAIYFSRRNKNDGIRPTYMPNSNSQANPSSAEPLSFDERYERFARTISNATMKGYLVADRNDKTLVAVLVKPQEKENHLLHFLISVISCGFWILVWIIISVNASKEQRVRISYDSAGNYFEERITV